MGFKFELLNSRWKSWRHGSYMHYIYNITLLETANNPCTISQIIIIDKLTVQFTNGFVLQVTFNKSYAVRGLNTY